MEIVEEGDEANAQTQRRHRHSRETLLEVLANDVAEEVHQQARTIPGTGTTFGCYYLDAAAQADRILRDTGIDPSNPSLTEQRAAQVSTDKLVGQKATMDLYHRVLEEARPELPGYESSLRDTVRFWPTVPTTKRNINRVHPDRAAYVVVGVAPRRLLDTPLLIADFARAKAVLAPLVKNMKLYQAKQPDEPFLASSYAEQPRERAEDYWESATVCTRRETLETAVCGDEYEWPELRYPGTVPPADHDAAVVVDIE